MLPFFTVGEPAPWFHCRTSARDRFAFDTVAGRYVVLAFFGSAGDATMARILRDVAAGRDRFDDARVTFFGISTDPADEREQRVADALPGVRYFWDFDRAVSTAYRAAGPDGAYRPVTYVLDPALRFIAAFPLKEGGEGHAAALFAFLDRLPQLPPPYRAPAHAPVLMVPRVFEPSLCEALIAHYEAVGGRDSGFMRDVGGRTTLIVDYGHKRRRDCNIEDAALREACRARIQSRLVPEIRKAFQFDATRMERYVVACYDAEESGHFRPHRDNTTKGTAHRRFAVSLFLNTGDYEGGELRFPEFGRALYAAPRGGAVVFSCSLLHEATPVTKGRRFMFLPFLYDEAARRVREENLRFLEGAAAESAENAPRDGALRGPP